MARDKYYNAYRSYRSALRTCTRREALGWIGFYCQDTRKIMERIR